MADQNFKEFTIEKIGPFRKGIAVAEGYVPRTFSDATFEEEPWSDAAKAYALITEDNKIITITPLNPIQRTIYGDYICKYPYVVHHAHRDYNTISCIFRFFSESGKLLDKEELAKYGNPIVYNDSYLSDYILDGNTKNWEHLVVVPKGEGVLYNEYNRTLYDFNTMKSLFTLPDGVQLDGNFKNGKCKINVIKDNRDCILEIKRNQIVRLLDVHDKEALQICIRIDEENGDVESIKKLSEILPKDEKMNMKVIAAALDSNFSYIFRYFSESWNNNKTFCDFYFNYISDRVITEENFQEGFSVKGEEVKIIRLLAEYTFRHPSYKAKYCLHFARNEKDKLRTEFGTNCHIFDRFFILTYCKSIITGGLEQFSDVTRMDLSENHRMFRIFNYKGEELSNGYYDSLIVNPRYPNQLFRLPLHCNKFLFKRGNDSGLLIVTNILKEYLFPSNFEDVYFYNDNLIVLINNKGSKKVIKCDLSKLQDGTDFQDFFAESANQAQDSPDNCTETEMPEDADVPEEFQDIQYLGEIHDDVDEHDFELESFHGYIDYGRKTTDYFLFKYRPFGNIYLNGETDYNMSADLDFIQSRGLSFLE